MEVHSEDWELASGTWSRGDDTGGWLPVARADGQRLSDRLSTAERLALVRTATIGRGSAGGDSRFPVEFVFSPDTGERLIPAPTPVSSPWIPPYGAQTVRPGSSQGSDARGLRQTAFDITVSQRPRSGSQSRRLATDDPDRNIPAPPPGQYEFAVGRFGTDVDVLLAIEPEKGTLFVWLPTGTRWESLSHDGGSYLAETSVHAAHWGAELQQDGANTILCLPTTAGLAVVRPDCLALSFSVGYLGSGAAVGAPVLWGGEAWAPLRDANGAITVIAVSSSGQLLRTQHSSIQAPEAVFGQPVCDAQQVIWPGQDGQLVVRKGPDGAAQCSWVAWPVDMRPAFSFGCPYLSATGRFWQLCRSSRDESYVYIQMGRSGAEIMTTMAPALCTGRCSYKMATRMKGDPWLDPSDTNDANSNDVVIPILESTKHGAVLGLVVEAEDGVTSLLESTAQHLAVVQLRSDASADVRFQTLIVPLPWLTRAFVFESCLWIYHPDEQAIIGTELVA